MVVFDRFIALDSGGVLRCGRPAGEHLPARNTSAAVVHHFAPGLVPAVRFFLRQLKFRPLASASLLELDVDGVRGLLGCGAVHPDSVSTQLVVR